MRELTHVVVHHSAVSHTLPLERVLKSFNRTHEARLTSQGQPLGGGEYPHVAYHVVIAHDGWAWVRDPEVMGYHASNYALNQASLGVCVNGNFDEGAPPQAMLDTLYEVLTYIRERFPTITELVPHRDYAGKSCPGTYFTPEMLEVAARYLRGEAEEKEELGVSAWAMDGWEWAKAHGIVQDGRPQDATTREEIVVMLHRYDQTEKNPTQPLKKA